VVWYGILGAIIFIRGWLVYRSPRDVDELPCHVRGIRVEGRECPLLASHFEAGFDPYGWSSLKRRVAAWVLDLIPGEKPLVRTPFERELESRVRAAKICWIRSPHPVMGLAVKSPPTFAVDTLVIGVEPWLRFLGPFLIASARDHEVTHVLQDIFRQVLERERNGRMGILHYFVVFESHAHIFGGPLAAALGVLVFLWPILFGLKIF
jgi:hypothetical protein